MIAELTAAEAATVERFEQAPDALVEDLRDEVAGVLAAHRLMFWAVDHVWGNEPESSRTAPRCSCGVLRSGGGYESVASQVAWWEAHVSRALLPLIAQREAAARAEGYATARKEAADSARGGAL